MKYTGWAIAAIAVVMVIYLQVCRTPTPVETDNAYKAFEKRIADTSHFYEELLKASDDAAGLAIAKAEQALLDQLKAEEDLKQSNGHVSTLTAQLRTAREDMRHVQLAGARGDTDTWIPVSPLYINTCDSLEVAADKQTVVSKQYKVSNDSLKLALAAQDDSYKTKIANQIKQTHSLQGQLSECTTKLKESPGSKRTQVYAGINLLGNKTYFIDGGQVNVTLLTKKNTMFEVNGALIHGQLYAGAGTKLLISFRKR